VSVNGIAIFAAAGQDGKVSVNGKRTFDSPLFRRTDRDRMSG
jgi:hypothetical protein